MAAIAKLLVRPPLTGKDCWSVTYKYVCTNKRATAPAGGCFGVLEPYDGKRTSTDRF